MATSRARSSDIKLIVSATVAVILAGLFIAGGILIGTRGDHAVACGQLNIGSATNVRQTLEKGGPYFQTGGAGCGFWLALDNDNIVAYKVEQADGCALRLKRDHWECGSRTIDTADLETYQVNVRTVGQTDSVIIDLDPTTTMPPTT